MPKTNKSSRGGGALPSLVGVAYKEANNRKGFGLTSIIIAVVALGAIMVPVTKWYMGMAVETDDLQTKMMMQTIIQDKWNTINAETFDDLNSTLSTKPSPWEEYIGEGNRYKIVTTISAEGKYANAECTSEPIGADNRKCRQVAIEITDTQTGKKQAVNLAKMDSEYFNNRLKNIETETAAIKSQMGELENLYYTKAQVDEQIAQSGGACQTTGYHYSFYYSVYDMGAETASGFWTGTKTVYSAASIRNDYTVKAGSPYTSNRDTFSVTCIRHYSCLDGVVNTTKTVWSTGTINRATARSFNRSCP